MLGGHYQDKSSIVAVSTSLASAAGIGIVRISGPFDLISFQNFFSRRLGSIGPGRFYRTKILDSDGTQIDDGGVVFFKGPHSYNGENILEVHMHGNPVLLRYFVSLITETKLARHALPGEFSYRAFLNAKMSLSQVEGLDLILSAGSMKGIRQGVSSLDGELHQSFEELYHCYLRFKSAIELNIDFLEDVGEEGGARELSESYADLQSRIDKLAKRCHSNVASLLRPKVVLLGKTNAGKSTLFNHLLGVDRSIVSSEEGTTRDYVSEELTLGSDSFTLVDTAGLRLNVGEIEEEGIKRAATLFHNAFFKILVINPQLEFDAQSLVNLDGVDLIVFTHADSLNFETKMKSFASFLPQVPRLSFAGKSGSIGPLEKEGGSIEPVAHSYSGPIEPAAQNYPGPIEPALGGVGSIGPIETLIRGKYLNLLKDDPLLIERQRSLILELRSEVGALEELLPGDIAVLSHEVSRLGQHLSELVGIISPDDVLHNIFNNFCIGK